MSERASPHRRNEEKGAQVNIQQDIREFLRWAGSSRLLLEPRFWAITAGATLLLVLLAMMIASLPHRITPRGIVIHHTGWIGQPVNARSLDQFHERSGYGAFYWGRTYHVGYHYVIYPDGRIEQGRPERLEGAHARHYNQYLGIALAGNFSPQHNPGGSRGRAEPTTAQVQALARLTRRLQATYQIPDHRVVLHRQVHATECPGSRFPQRLFYRMLAGIALQSDR